MVEPSFRELFASRSHPATEIVERFADVTRRKFDFEHGVPLVVAAPDDTDIAFLLAALGRSSIPVAPIVVDNAPDQGRAGEMARAMGAQVVEEPVPGQMSALQTGICKAEADYREAPILVVDDDCLPTRHWAKMLTTKAGLSGYTGGIAYGGVVLEHGPSFATDALRTCYALAKDWARKIRQDTPEARGPNGLLQLDAKGKIIRRLLMQPPNIFPCDLKIQEAVLGAGGVARFVSNPGAFMFTRGDRFANLGTLTRDLRERGQQREKLYRITE